MLAVELANRESRSSWRDFLLGLKARGLHGVEFVEADDHAGLRAALREVLAEAAYQRCYVHFLRNATCRAGSTTTACRELRWLYDRRDLPEARRDLAAWFVADSPLDDPAMIGDAPMAFFPEEGWLDPVVYADAMLFAARLRHRANVICGARVVDLIMAGDRVTGVRVAEGAQYEATRFSS